MLNGKPSCTESEWFESGDRDYAAWIRWWDHYITCMNQRSRNDVDLAESSRLSGRFSEVHVRKVSTSFWRNNEFIDPALVGFGEIMQRVWFGAYNGALDPKLIAYGLTDEVKACWVQEASDTDRNVGVDTYITCARKA
ncbi:hypothetical protein JB92DRAFT_3141282 [Gautieria morchelliformis]|nr:hypothetical protein JB92DRAFT_3141282 [Gautieria morchelliformis]